jgi:hypothetical protein
MRRDEGNFPRCVGGVLACEGSHDKADLEKPQRHQTTPKGQPETVAEGVSGQLGLGTLSPAFKKTRDDAQDQGGGKS